MWILIRAPTFCFVPWAKIETEEGRIIVCHGHNIGLVKRKEETWREAAGRLKEKLVREGNKNLPKIERGDKIIISHTHTPFFDMENGVFATGGWKVKKELEENEEYIKRNVGVFIIIKDADRNDPIKMKRYMKTKKKSKK